MITIKIKNKSQPLQESNKSQLFEALSFEEIISKIQDKKLLQLLIQYIPRDVSDKRKALSLIWLDKQYKKNQDLPSDVATLSRNLEHFFLFLDQIPEKERN